MTTIKRDMLAMIHAAHPMKVRASSLAMILNKPFDEIEGVLGEMMHEGALQSSRDSDGVVVWCLPHDAEEITRRKVDRQLQKALSDATRSPLGMPTSSDTFRTWLRAAGLDVVLAR